MRAHIYMCVLAAMMTTDAITRARQRVSTSRKRLAIVSASIVSA